MKTSHVIAVIQAFLFRMTQLCEWPLQFMLTHVLNHLSDMLRSSESAAWNGDDSSILATHNLPFLQGGALTRRKCPLNVYS